MVKVCYKRAMFMVWDLVAQLNGLRRCRRQPQAAPLRGSRLTTIVFVFPRPSVITKNSENLHLEEKNAKGQSPRV
jgi:hypothetical protein